MGSGLGEIYDPGLIPIKLKAKIEEASSTQDSPSAGQPSTSASSTTNNTTQATSVPKWSARGWKKPNAEEDKGPVSESKEMNANSTDVPTGDRSGEGSITVKAEPAGVASEQAIISDIAKALEVKVEGSAIKAEDTERSVVAAPSGMFRKRKLRGGGVGTRGRAD